METRKAFDGGVHDSAPAFGRGEENGTSARDAVTIPEPSHDTVEAGASQPTIFPLEARSVRPRDLPGLRNLDALYRLNLPESLLTSYSALRSGMKACLARGRRAQPVLVACAGDRLVGFAHFQPTGPDGRWICLALGSSVGVFNVDPVWEALLTQGVRAAGLRGVRRLYARLPQSVPAGEAFRRQGWAPYAAETLFVAHQDVAVPGAGAGLRRQEPSDTWAIHQLYNQSVPKRVQEAEAYTSHRWDARSQPGGTDGATVVGVLIEDGQRLVGYARTCSRAGSHYVELVYHPERRDILHDLISGALAALTVRPLRRVYCAVRGYQAEAATALEDRGFAPMLEQELFVKYTTANVRLPAVESVPFHVEVRDKLPQRVPSFLHGRARD